MAVGRPVSKALRAVFEIRLFLLLLVKAIGSVYLSALITSFTVSSCLTLHVRVKRPRVTRIGRVRGRSVALCMYCL